jgi:hypothetical protein
LSGEEEEGEEEEEEEEEDWWLLDQVATSSHLVKRQKQHINPTTNKGYNSPFLPWLSGPKRQPRIPKTAAQESRHRRITNNSWGNGQRQEKYILFFSWETSNHRNGFRQDSRNRIQIQPRRSKKDIVDEQNRIVSEAKEEAEKRICDDEK